MDKAKLQANLNQVKDLLSPERMPDFEKRKNSSTFEQSIRDVRQDLVQDYSAQHVTKGWLKGYQLVSFLVNAKALPTNRKIKAFFNADLPGGFVFAVNHRLKGNLDWVIASYLPRSSDKDYINDQFGLMAKNPDRTLVGTVRVRQAGKEFLLWNTGDMTDSKAILATQQLVLSKLGKVDLYTADGAFDTSGDDNNQEDRMIDLITGEIELGIQVLAPDGCMIVKIFTFFSEPMEKIIGKMGMYFRRVQYLKPDASSPMNSEVYLVGMSFIPEGNITDGQFSSRDAEIREQLVTDQMWAIANFVDKGETRAIKTPKLSILAPDKKILSD